MLIVVLFIDYFASILLGKSEYFEALAIVPIILLANLFLGIYNNLSIWYKLTDNTKYGMYFSIIGAIITIVLNVILIPKIGFMGSAYATLAAFGSMMLISYFFGRKHYPVNYNLKKVGYYLVTSLAFCGVSFRLFRGEYWFSILTIFLFFGLIYFNERKELKQLLKR